MHFHMFIHSSKYEQSIHIFTFTCINMVMAFKRVRNSVVCHCNETSLVVLFVLQNNMGIFSTSDVGSC